MLELINAPISKYSNGSNDKVGVVEGNDTSTSISTTSTFIWLFGRKYCASSVLDGQRFFELRRQNRSAFSSFSSKDTSPKEGYPAVTIFNRPDKARCSASPVELPSSNLLAKSCCQLLPLRRLILAVFNFSIGPWVAPLLLRQVMNFLYPQAGFLSAHSFVVPLRFGACGAEHH